MILIIMRHGEAVEYREPDSTRALTDYGMQQCENVGKWLSQNLLRLSSVSERADASQVVANIDLALVSPYLRTQQTISALAKHVSVHNQETIEAITPIGNAAQCADLIHAYACDSDAPNCMLIVTHMPLVSLLSDRMCAGFNASFFDTADTLIIDYACDTGIGKQLVMYQGG
ncbi:MAG: phosphohistidine phosphatase [Alphaproteobacteria bacterium]|jgi:phosphohistidine phosphatase